MERFAIRHLAFKGTGVTVSTAVTQLALWPSDNAAIAEPTGVVSKDVMTPASVHAARWQRAVSPRHREKWPDSRVSLRETSVYRTRGPLSAGRLVLRWATGRTGPAGLIGPISPIGPIGLIGLIRPIGCWGTHHLGCWGEHHFDPSSPECPPATGPQCKQPRTPVRGWFCVRASAFIRRSCVTWQRAVSPWQPRGTCVNRIASASRSIDRWYRLMILSSGTE